MSILYNKIEFLCKQRNTTITAMCRELDISRSSLTELKSGRTKSLSSDAMSKIANYFNIDLDSIYSDDEFTVSKVYQAINKLIDETSNDKIVWCRITVDPFLDNMEVSDNKVVIDTEELNIGQIDMENSFFAKYKTGGYLLCSKGHSYSNFEFRFYVFYKNRFSLVADEKDSNFLKGLYDAIVMKINGVDEFLNNFLSDDNI